MSLGRVQTRLLIVAGWLLGVGTATSISLLAVSLLGQGIISSPGQQLTVAAVNRALASEHSEPSATPAASAGSAVRAPAVSDPSPSRIPSPSAAPATRPGPARTASYGRLLTSVGGSVVAGCGPGGAYLSSWSPQQGFEVASVIRGPAPVTKAVFRSNRDSVTVLVSCHGGTPVADTQAGGWHGGDE